MKIYQLKRKKWYMHTQVFVMASSVGVGSWSFVPGAESLLKPDGRLQEL